MILDINYSDTIYGDTCIDERIDNELIREAAVYLISSEIFDEFNDEVLKRATELPIYIGVSLVSEDEIKDINREFRGIDKVTDVLSFPQFESVDELLDEIEGDEALVDIPLGDVVICLDQAERQSKEYGTSIRREVTYLFVHSILHLLGYDHMEDDEKAYMRAHEERVMATLDILR
ncbi:rRNA maturation RNase YbeY [Mogibacterium neglectum]|uniref:rRNA maturation RNase YbeY n=1 Tax=Mogibacterium neglectum TaxID=114528 RepID=UPI00272C09D7|nr:rRNA maturation RNase YbeY [Mogibacterium neglectum]WLD75673.1 rRNA maturation RNase YbeY [Mogibacterium neglectum]